MGNLSQDPGEREHEEDGQEELDQLQVTRLQGSGGQPCAVYGSAFQQP
jgi:hypothetical protein